MTGVFAWVISDNEMLDVTWARECGPYRANRAHGDTSRALSQRATGISRTVMSSRGSGPAMG
jgi:hypothetical protein